MNFKEKIRVIPDFPQPGIRFKDITTLLKDGKAFHAAIDTLVDSLKEKEIDVSMIQGVAAISYAGESTRYPLQSNFI